jgi:hypothetical protein
MADYPTLATTIAALNVTKNDPQGTEASSKLDDAVRQTRNWLVDYLSTKFDSTSEKIKAASFDSVTPSNSVPSGLIRGSVDNTVGAAQREILAGSLSTNDYRDSSVTAAKIAADAVSTVKILDANVTEAKVATNAITAAKIAANAVTTEKVSNEAITVDKLAANAVIAAKIKDKEISSAKLADRTLEGDKFPSAPAGFMYVGGNTVNGISDCIALKQVSGDMTVDANGVFTLASTAALRAGFGYWRLAERKSNGSQGGDGIAGSWNQRGSQSSADWTIEDSSHANVLSVDTVNNRVNVHVSGTYLIRAAAPAYSVGRHKVKLKVKTDGVSALASAIREWHGSNAQCLPLLNVRSTGGGAYAETDVSVNGTMSHSFIEVMVTISNASLANPGWIELWHFLGLAAGGTAAVVAVGATIANAFGIATTQTAASANSPERYATIEILRLKATEV